MQCFGWNLTNRQEMVVEGDSKVELDWSGDPVTKTNVSKYVKSHFSRSLDLPNLEKIKALENEYAQISIPKKKGLGCSIALIVFGAIGFVQIAQNPAGALIAGGVCLGIGVWWLRGNMKQNTEISNSIEESLQKRQKLMKEAKVLLRV